MLDHIQAMYRLWSARRLIKSVERNRVKLINATSAEQQAITMKEIWCGIAIVCLLIFICCIDGYFKY